MCQMSVKIRVNVHCSSLSLSLSLSGTFSLRQAPAPLLCSARPRQATPWPRGRSTRPLHGPCPATHSPAAPSSSRSPLSTAHGGARPSVPWLSPCCSLYCSVTALVGETLMLCSMFGSHRSVQQLVKSTSFIHSFNLFCFN